MKQISISNANLTQEMPQTYLTGDTASGVGSITVKNITGFAVNQILLIGELGNEGTEKIKTHTSTAPTGFTITLAANTIYPHSAGTPIRVMLYDQVKIYSAPTETGTKTLLATVDITVDCDYTYYNDTLPTTGYYFSQFYNTVSTASSSYTDPIPTGGYTVLSARLLIDNALEMINKEGSPLLNDTFAFHQINNCQEETLREFKRWSFLQIFDYNLGHLLTGQWKVSMPTDCDNQFSNKSIWNFRIGTETNMTWVDRQKWNEIIKGTAHTTLASNIVVGATTIILTNSSDFATGGSVYIGTNIYEYTANDMVTGILTLNSASTTTDTAGTDVFQGGTLGRPQYWTTVEGYIYFYPVLGNTYNHKNAYLDYYKAPVTIVNDTDQIVLTDPTVVQYYLAWKMLLRMNNGVETDGTKQMYNNYVIRREKLKQKEVLGRSFSLKPLLNQINVNDNVDEKQVRTGNFPTYY
jgi:hypothetical protein